MAKITRPIKPDKNGIPNLSGIMDFKDNKLAKVFNHFMDNPGDRTHAQEYWEMLIEECKKNSSKEDIVYLIKYLFLDYFGCSIPSFIDFEFKLTGNKFENISIITHDFGDSKSGSKEIHSGW